MQTIPCPQCNIPIQFDSKQLLMGVQFSCPNCQTTLGLAQESKPLVTQTIEKLEDLKIKKDR